MKASTILIFFSNVKSQISTKRLSVSRCQNRDRDRDEMLRHASRSWQAQPNLVSPTVTPRQSSIYVIVTCVMDHDIWTRNHELGSDRLCRECSSIQSLNWRSYRIRFGHPIDIENMLGSTLDSEGFIPSLRISTNLCATTLYWSVNFDIYTNETNSLATT